MAVTTDCAEGRHDVCRGRGPNHYFPQTAHLGDQRCACGCHEVHGRDYSGMRGPVPTDYRAHDWQTCKLLRALGEAWGARVLRTGRDVAWWPR